MTTSVNTQTQAIAKTFLKIAEENGVALTTFRLIKLIYMAHRIMLSLFQRPLIVNESFAHWRHGPTLESLHPTIKCFDGRCISFSAVEISAWRWFDSDPEMRQAMALALNKFGMMPISELSDLAFKSDLIWRNHLKNTSGTLIDIN